ncbi:MAG: hypothetical protein GWO44_17285, partial [Thermoplasmata archaeon]|nr:hypothetical protein [Thermoplasmata archaeon]NIY04955.1 hypothetical protein [Thermoplasmata archaeon]
RSFSELTVVIPATGAVEPPGETGDPTQDYTEQPGLCPSPDNEKIRYLDRRVSNAT